MLHKGTTSNWKSTTNQSNTTTNKFMRFWNCLRHNSNNSSIISQQQQQLKQRQQNNWKQVPAPRADHWGGWSWNIRDMAMTTASILELSWPHVSLFCFQISHRHQEFNFQRQMFAYASEISTNRTPVVELLLLVYVAVLRFLQLKTILQTISRFERILIIIEV